MSGPGFDESDEDNWLWLISVLTHTPAQHSSASSPNQLQQSAHCSLQQPPVRHRRQLREDGGGGALPAGVQLHAVLDHAGGLHRGARHRRHLLQVLIIENTVLPSAN